MPPTESDGAANSMGANNKILPLMAQSSECSPKFVVVLVVPTTSVPQPILPQHATEGKLNLNIIKTLFNYLQILFSFNCLERTQSKKQRPSQTVQRKAKEKQRSHAAKLQSTLLLKLLTNRQLLWLQVCQFGFVCFTCHSFLPSPLSWTSRVAMHACIIRGGEIKRSKRDWTVSHRRNEHDRNTHFKHCPLLTVPMWTPVVASFLFLPWAHINS